jgi:hypothetical protein
LEGEVLLYGVNGGEVVVFDLAKLKKAVSSVSSLSERSINIEDITYFSHSFGA